LIGTEANTPVWLMMKAEATQKLRSLASPLDLLFYAGLRQQILRRDGWRCQSCGSMSNLEVHHRGVSQSFRDRFRRKLDHAVHGMSR
jgi:hypothetical protein